LELRAAGRRVPGAGLLTPAVETTTVEVRVETTTAGEVPAVAHKEPPSSERDREPLRAPTLS
jgi:hypothetical protein